MTHATTMRQLQAATGAGRSASPAKRCNTAVAEQAGIFLVTCEARTVFADRLARRLRAAGCIIAFDRGPAASPAVILAALSRQPDINFNAESCAARLRRLAETLERRCSIIPIVIIDSADLLGVPAIRELALVLDAGGDRWSGRLADDS